MASHPTFDPNQLDALGTALTQDKNSPLLNRGGLGSYDPGESLAPLQSAAGATVAPAELASLFQRLGFYAAPRIRMPVATPSAIGETKNVKVSPLQMALAAASSQQRGRAAGAQDCLGGKYAAGRLGGPSSARGGVCGISHQTALRRRRWHTQNRSGPTGSGRPPPNQMKGPLCGTSAARCRVGAARRYLWRWFSNPTIWLLQIASARALWTRPSVLSRARHCRLRRPSTSK